MFLSIKRFTNFVKLKVETQGAQIEIALFKVLVFDIIIINFIYKGTMYILLGYKLINNKTSLFKIDVSRMKNIIFMKILKIICFYFFSW